MENKTNDEVLLRVEHLCQYFKIAPGHETKAVDDVSFDIKKGEVFGLVGESGCGKTTTGRSIIKLYDITSGNVYFKGHRICAGTRSYTEAIKGLKKELKNAKTPDEVRSIKEKIAEQKAEMKSAKFDHKNCEKQYLAELKKEYASELSRVNGDKSKLSEEQRKRYKAVENLPKIPKGVFASVFSVLFAVALLFLVLAIATNTNFKKTYGDFKSASAVVVESDEEAQTTTVTYDFTNKNNETRTYTKVLDYFDPELGVSTPEQKIRLKVYFHPTSPERSQVDKPIEKRVPIYLALTVIFAVAGLIVAVYTHERFNTSHLITQIQMIFQDPIASLNPRMTVKDIISEGLIIGGERDQKYIDEQVYKVLELIGLVPEHAGRYPHEFSGGQRQRIGVARSVVMNPELIIADEPVSALDVSIQAQVINLLNELRDSLGLTILFIAHDLSVVKYFSDRIGVMYFGKMVELASSDELFEHPLHPYTRSLLSAIPLPDPNYEKRRQRYVYNPLAEHDYSKDQPSFREVAPGHFVMCNDEEFDRYVRVLNDEK